MAGVDMPDQLTRIKASMKDHGMGKKKRKNNRMQQAKYLCISPRIDEYVALYCRKKTANVIMIINLEMKKLSFGLSGESKANLMINF